MESTIIDKLDETKLSYKLRVLFEEADDAYWNNLDAITDLRKQLTKLYKSNPRNKEIQLDYRLIQHICMAYSLVWAINGNDCYDGDIGAAICFYYHGGDEETLKHLVGVVNLVDFLSRVEENNIDEKAADQLFKQQGIEEHLQWELPFGEVQMAIDYFKKRIELHKSKKTTKKKAKKLWKKRKNIFSIA